ncbi:MAG: hypothetical protein HPY76_07880, partial [Anaerolineae bacterium]|nr:hypothetical protein [Anaerolineae bacterium]
MSTSFRSLRHQPVTLSPGGVSIGGVPLNDDGAIRLPGSRQALNGRHLRLTAKHFSTLLPGGHPPQLSLLAFNLTDDPQTLEHYFPLAQSMPANIKTDFYRTLTHLAETQTLVVTLTGSAKRDRTPALPAGIRHLLAGMILEPLFFRPDLLERFFQHPKLFRFYTSAQALREDGGVSGGCYQPRKRIMQLALSRLWEGCDQPQVGTSPFLHEFGHMLDAFDERSGLLGSLDGFLPGMDEPARKAFNEGKAIELARYQECQHQAQPDRSRQPLGHPYVF